MRVTNKMLSNSFLSDMSNNLRNLQTLQQQMTSGKQIRKASDDPVKAVRIMQIYTDIDSNIQYNDNIKDCINMLDTTDTALGQAGNVLQRIRELLVSAGNGTYDANEHKAIKDEINQRIGEFTQALNTNFDGHYIFGGTRGNVKPVDSITNGTASVGIVTNLNELGGTGTVTGSYTGNKDAVYQVKITEVDGGAGTGVGQVTKMQYSTDGGTTWSADIPSPGTLGTDGLSFNIGTNANNAVGNLFTFAATAKNDSKNTKLIYYSNDSASPELAAAPSGTATSGYNEFSKITAKMEIEISQGVRIEGNVSASDVINFKNEKGTKLDLRDIFTKVVNHLDGKSDDGTVSDPQGASLKLINGDLQNVQDAINNLLSIRSAVGAKQNSMESAKAKNEDENFSMTQILSKTEDIDITEKTMEYATLQSVYTASLQTSAKVLQPSLLDYLR